MGERMVTVETGEQEILQSKRQSDSLTLHLEVACL